MLAQAAELNVPVLHAITLFLEKNDADEAAAFYPLEKVAFYLFFFCFLCLFTWAPASGRSRSGGLHVFAVSDLCVARGRGTLARAAAAGRSPRLLVFSRRSKRLLSLFALLCLVLLTLLLSSTLCLMPEPRQCRHGRRRRRSKERWGCLCSSCATERRARRPSRWPARQETEEKAGVFSLLIPFTKADELASLEVAACFHLGDEAGVKAAIHTLVMRARAPNPSASTA